MTTPSKVNRELEKLNIAGKIVRGRGYYYFIGELFDVVPSIYSYNLHGWTVAQVVEYIKKAFSK